MQSTHWDGRSCIGIAEQRLINPRSHVRGRARTAIPTSARHGAQFHERVSRDCSAKSKNFPRRVGPIKPTQEGRRDVSSQPRQHSSGDREKQSAETFLPGPSARGAQHQKQSRTQQRPRTRQRSRSKSRSWARRPRSRSREQQLELEQPTDGSTTTTREHEPQPNSPLESRERQRPGPRARQRPGLRFRGTSDKKRTTPSGAIRCQDGLVRPTNRLAKAIVRLKKRRLVQEIPVATVDPAEELTFVNQDLSALPGQQPPAAQHELAQLRAGRSTDHINVRTCFAFWAYAVFLQEEWDRTEKEIPASSSPIGRLRRCLPAWKKAFPTARFQHNLIEKGFVSLHPGYRCQTRLPAALAVDKNRDLIMEELLPELEVGVISMLTRESHPKFFDSNSAPILRGDRFFVSVFHILQKGKE